MPDQPGQWIVLDQSTAWQGDHVAGHLAEVVSPTGRRLTYEVVRAGSEGAAALIVDDAGRVLLIWRHRFIPDRWGWELPAGGLLPGEDPVTAAVREAFEETGWEMLDPRFVRSLWRCPERSDHVGHLVAGRAGRQLGDPDPDEVARLGWFGADQLHELLTGGTVGDVFTAAALWWWLAEKAPTGRI